MLLRALLYKDKNYKSITNDLTKARYFHIADARGRLLPIKYKNKIYRLIRFPKNLSKDQKIFYVQEKLISFELLIEGYKLLAKEKKKIAKEKKKKVKVGRINNALLFKNKNYKSLTNKIREANYFHLADSKDRLIPIKYKNKIYRFFKFPRNISVSEKKRLIREQLTRVNLLIEGFKLLAKEKKELREEFLLREENLEKYTRDLSNILLEHEEAVPQEKWSINKSKIIKQKVKLRFNNKTYNLSEFIIKIPTESYKRVYRAKTNIKSFSSKSKAAFKIFKQEIVQDIYFKKPIFFDDNTFEIAYKTLKEIVLLHGDKIFKKLGKKLKYVHVAFGNYYLTSDGEEIEGFFSSTEKQLLDYNNSFDNHLEEALSSSKSMKSLRDYLINKTQKDSGTGRISKRDNDYISSEVRSIHISFSYEHDELAVYSDVDRSAVDKTVKKLRELNKKYDINNVFKNIRKIR